MKNKIFVLIAVVVLCLTMIFPASAADAHIFDSTNKFGQITELEAYAQNIEDTYSFEVLLAVVDGVGSYESTYDYCEDLYKSKSDNENGLALAYNYGDNIYSFYCAGSAESLFTVDILENVLWKAFANTETYYEGGYAYLVALEEILSKADVLSSDTSTTVQPDEAETEATTEFVPSDRTLELVEDYADVLTDAEEADLISKLETLGNKYDVEVAAVTVDSYEGKDPQAFADDFYDYNGYGYGANDDGVMVVFNTGEGDGNRNIAITTHGKGIELLTDIEIDRIIEMMINPIENGDFAGAFDNFVYECESAFGESISIFWIPVSILAGFALAYIIVKIQASKLKTVREQVNAADYVGEVMLTAQYDNFMYRNVRSTPKSNSSSGGSTHTSSSGRTHGGGNKSF